MKTLLMLLMMTLPTIALADCEELEAAHFLAWSIEIDHKVWYLQVHSNWHTQLDEIAEFEVQMEEAGFWSWYMQPILDSLKWQADQYFDNTVYPAGVAWMASTEEKDAAKLAWDACLGGTP